MPLWRTTDADHICIVNSQRSEIDYRCLNGTVHSLMEETNRHINYMASHFVLQQVEICKGSRNNSGVGNIRFIEGVGMVQETCIEAETAEQGFEG